MSDAWPPKLKEWVARCLGQMTDSNRAAASAEMKAAIAGAFERDALWTTDWAGVQLQALLPKPLPTPGGTKRKNENGTPTGKKARKSALARAAVSEPDAAALRARAQRFQREHALEAAKASGKGSLLSRTGGWAAADDDGADVKNWDRHTIVGTSRQVFKDYLRLTSEPKPEQIRPLEVLQQTLAELKEKWRDFSTRADTQYNWICSQFKSLRQDLVVQRIANAFTVKVYEIHARIALQVGDDVEYNACLNKLQGLYDLGLEGQREEFTAYQILQLVRGLNHSQLNLYVARLTREQKAAETVAHALAVQRACAAGNYTAFFRLHVAAPMMSGYIMDHMRDRERIKALVVLSRAYMRLPVAFVSRELAFEDLLDAEDAMDPAAAGAAEAVAFLAKHKVVCYTNPNAPDADKILDCRACQDVFPRVFEEQYRKVKLKARI